MKNPVLPVAFSAAVLLSGLLSGCATAEFKQASDECRNRTMPLYPVALQERLFRRSRKVWVPDGSTVCESSVTTTSTGNQSKRSSTADTNDAKGEKKRTSSDISAKSDKADKRERKSSVSTETTLSTQVCRPGMREALEFYDEPVQVDVNAEAREQAVASCTADLCLQRYGNRNCKR